MFFVGIENFPVDLLTFGEMRSGRSGTRGILVHCADYKCSHSIAMLADRWPGDVRHSDIEPRFVCKACGKRGADVRPDWQSVESQFPALATM
jgi:hypothetical protein